MALQTKDLILGRFPVKIQPFVMIIAGVFVQATFGILYTFAGTSFTFIFGGYLERYLGARIGVLISSAMYSGAIAVTYFTIQHSFLLLLLSFGIVMSIGQSMAYACLMVPAQKWFPNRIGFASGVIIAGFGIGGFVMSPIETKFTNPRNLKTDDDDYFDDSELLDRIPYLFLILGAGCGVVQLLGSFFIAGPASLESQEESEHKKTIVKTESEVRLTICQTCMSPMVQIMFITMFLNGVWLQVMSGLFKAYGEKFIKDDLFLAVTDSMGAVSNTISRVIWGYVVDKLAYQKSMLILCTIGSFFIWTLPLIRLWAEKYVFLLWIFIMFSCLGGTYALIPYCLHRCYGSYNFGVAYGVVQGALIFSALASALMSQFLLDVIDYDWMFVSIGGFLYISMFLNIFIQYTKYSSIPGVCYPYRQE